MQIVEKNVRLLLPDELAPCDIFLHFRGKYVPIVGSGQAINSAVLDRLAKAKSQKVYIKVQSNEAFDRWVQGRYPASTAVKESNEDHKAQLFGNKRAGLLSFIQKAVQSRNSQDEKINSLLSDSLKCIQRVSQSPMLAWYFQKFHEPADLFHHNGRVALLCAYLCLRNAQIESKLVDDIVYSALIHQIEGEPTDSLTTMVSEQTLATLEKNKHPAPEEVVKLIRMHDELCSGKGYPNRLDKNSLPITQKIFSIVNQFDHYRLKAAGTRRARFDQAKLQMSARKIDFDDSIWSEFWLVVEKDLEVIN